MSEPVPGPEKKVVQHYPPPEPDEVLRPDSP